MSLHPMIFTLSCVIIFVARVSIVEAKAPKSTVCESFGGQLETCEIRSANGIALKRRMSKNRCVEGESFGLYRRDQMWVAKGCRGEFVARRYGAEVFSRPGMARPQENGYAAKPWVNPDTGRAVGSTAGSWRNPDASHRKTPREWAYLAGRLYSKNKAGGYSNSQNTYHVKNELRKQGVDPSAIERGGLLRDDFVRGLRSWR
jgi:hypothetical protein